MKRIGNVGEYRYDKTEAALSEKIDQVKFYCCTFSLEFGVSRGPLRDRFP